MIYRVNIRHNIHVPDYGRVRVTDIVHVAADDIPNAITKANKYFRDEAVRDEAVEIMSLEKVELPVGRQ
jgi:hypothetical protein